MAFNILNSFKLLLKKNYDPHDHILVKWILKD